MHFFDPNNTWNGQTQKAYAYSLKLQSTNLAHEAFHKHHHLPRSQLVSGGPARPAFGDAVVLRQPSGRVGRRPDIQRGMTDRGSQEIAAVKGRDRFGCRNFVLIEGGWGRSHWRRILGGIQISM